MKFGNTAFEKSHVIETQATNALYTGLIATRYQPRILLVSHFIKGYNTKSGEKGRAHLIYCPCCGLGELLSQLHDE